MKVDLYYLTGRALLRNPHCFPDFFVDTLPMKQRHYTFATVFFVIAALVLTSAAWRDFVHTNVIDTGVSNVNYVGS
jgi:hypothetical protein